MTTISQLSLTPELPHSTFFDSLQESTIQGVAFMVAAVVAHLFFPPLVAPFLGIGCGLFTARLALKILNCYDSKVLIQLTKATCKFNKKHPHLQVIGIIFTLSMSLISANVGAILGLGMGCYNAIRLDVVKYKLIQKTSRATNLES